MAVTKIVLQDRLTPIQEQWVYKNVGPRMFWLHNSIGGYGWVLKRNYKETNWELSFEDEKHAVLFTLTCL